MINEIGLPFDNHGGIIFVALLIVIEWFMRKDERNPINIKVNMRDGYFMHFLVFSFRLPSNN